MSQPNNTKTARSMFRPVSPALSSSSSTSSSGRTSNHQVPQTMPQNQMMIDEAEFIDPLNTTPPANYAKYKQSNGSNVYKNPESATTSDAPRQKTKNRSISPHSRLLRRTRSGSSSTNGGSDDNDDKRPTIVAVTSCRSDAYYHQKAPGSASKLPTKAPSALKLFHELATGVKDAYDAVGAMPTRPEMGEDGSVKASDSEIVLWEFMGNLDFLLALVDEVAVDTATRGALKDDTTFKCLRDVIKKGNKVLENMLVRRERKYTLFFRLTTTQNQKQIAKMKVWNLKVEKAVGAVTAVRKREGTDIDSVTSDKSEENSSIGSASKNIVSRGRNIFVKGGTKGRRATPTPRMRTMYAINGPKQLGNAAEDGFYANPVGKLPDGDLNMNPPNNTPNKNAAMTPANLKQLQPNSISPQNPNQIQNEAAFIQQSNLMQSPQTQNLSMSLNNQIKPIQPKDELVDIVRGLKVEKQLKSTEGTTGDPSELKPNWQPKADIPAAVPKLPTEYIHRHRLMKQVINCLLDRPGAGPRDTDEENNSQCYITSITSRHSDKAGNGKTTLAVAAIQSVEIRERFCDGICWIKLGRRPLTENGIRSLYEELHRQLVSPNDELEDEKGTPNEGIESSESSDSSSKEDGEEDESIQSIQNPYLSKSRRRFQTGELEGMKEDLFQIISKRKILICLDDVWSIDDAHWFLFHFKNKGNAGNEEENDNYHFRILITTRQPGLLGSGNSQEIFVRIFSENEAVKLLLASAGRRPYGGRNSPVFLESRVVVKGCGNSPLAVRLAGGILGRMKFWTNHSPTWAALLETCKTSLEGATKLRSFSNAVGLIVDTSFSTIEDLELKAILRTCFVTFAMVFQENDHLKNGRGIPKSVVLNLFDVIKDSGKGKENAAMNKKDQAQRKITSDALIDTLEKVHLIEKVRQLRSKKASDKLQFNSGKKDDKSKGGMKKVISSVMKGGIVTGLDPETSKEDVLEPCYIMHDAIIALADDMAKRNTPSFAPASEEEQGNNIFAPLRNAAKYFAQLTNRDDRVTMTGFQFHELMVASLLNGWIASSESSVTTQLSSMEFKSKGIEQYTYEFLPNHLIKAKAFVSAGELVSDKKFIAKRVSMLGSMDASRRHVADLIDLKKESSKSESPKSNNLGDDENTVNTEKESGTIGESTGLNQSQKNKDLNIPGIVRDASRRIGDEIYRIESDNDAPSLAMAFSLSAIGEGLIRCRQARDAMLRLEEAAGVYRSILGPYHIDVARALSCVAKSLVKMGENRVALLKYGEAARIYEACNATRHFDSISNSQNMASLLVDLGDYRRAEAKYDHVLQLRKSVHGQMSYQVARTHNEFAAILAKQGKLEEAIHHYEEARVSLRGAANLYSSDADDFDDRFNTTVIDLNIASIKAKKGDIEGAIHCYEIVVQDLKASRNRDNERNEGATYSKHIIAAMSRIGSLKLKLRDNSGALDMFEGILSELQGNDEKTNAIKLETARAHIKCATIYRQGRSSTKQAISHLREALKYYNQIYGPDHRDTRALSASLKQWQQDEHSGTASVTGEKWD